ncbi:hypothetical protein N7470_002317 [Penicillium chermesinum]|nr:hypothetical protein N7470_002317 [Penicillium chermesinum]
MKSRRTRARDSNAEALLPPEEIAFDQKRYYEDRLEIFVNADDWLFNTVGSLFSKLDIDALGDISSLREKATTVNDSDTVPEDPETRLFHDVRGIIKSWNDEKSRLMQQKDEASSLKDMRGSSKSGLAVFLEHTRKVSRKPFQQKVIPSREKLYAFSSNVNGGWLHPHDASFEWLKQLLMPQPDGEDQRFSPMRSAYASFVWPDDLKSTVANMLLREDEFIYSRLSELTEGLGRRILESGVGSPFQYRTEDFAELEMIQSVYEIHLDIFASVENLSGENNEDKRLTQRDRLNRWGLLAKTALDYFIANCPSEECRRNIALRYLWTSVFHLNLAGEADRDHVLLCLQDLKQTLQSIEAPVISMVNNTIMSELSVETIDQEVLKLKCMDFFAKVFNADDEDPVSLIEAIEPILEPSSVESADDTLQQHDATTSEAPSQSSEMASFLDRGDATLRLFLWRRLQEAYQAIDYPPKVVSCYLRSIEIIMAELEDEKHVEETNEHRQVTLLGWLKSLDSLMGKAIPLILTQAEKSYECVDMDHLRSSMSAVARLTRVLHSFILYEDSVRVGQVPGRELRGALAKSLESFKERMRELYVRCWILQYTLFVEAISQNKELFDDALEDRIHVLRSLHNALGIRSMCRYSQKRFLKLMKSELFGLEIKGDYEDEVCQVLYDLHGIKFSPLDGTADHGCSPEKLDRLTATMMIDFVLRQANKMNMKDLSKSELKTTIEKMQQAIGPVRLPSQSPAVQLNRRVWSQYMKTPINPSLLLRAVQGVTELSMVPVSGDNANIAAKGWYFLLGHATLTKFRAQKRLNPGSTSELDDAINLFKQDLENGTGRWETFYRLAQTYDTKLEEDITWNADKINNSRNDLATTQRYAIHCYSIAVSAAIRTAEPTAEARALISDLYTDFAIRLYSSSREPLSMGAFSLTDFPKHYNSQESQQMYKGQPFREMPLYSVWSFASNLLRRAIADKPNRWMNHYYLGKCMWKMFCAGESERTTSKRVEIQDVLDAFHDAIDALPRRKDSRAEPIFEPHFKLLSIVNRLVSGGSLTPAEGVKALGSTPWAAKVSPPESLEGWKPYVLEVIKKFKTADKSNWHHRMSAKAAHIIYDDQINATTAAAAKHEMSQIFTKTLTIQVWRPEYERPGRHFVYTTRYVYFFVNLLDQLDDRASLDQLLRRVRKKQGDFINHAKLWEDLCVTYAKMIRRAANINEGYEEGIFRPLGWEEFSSKTARLEGLPSLTADSQPLLELVRDSLELKKLNNNYMKVTMCEDLVADLYSRVYELNIPLLNEQVSEENKEKMKVDHLLMAGDAPTETSTPTASLPASDTPAPRGRTKGIARRDIQKRADTIVNLKLGPRTAAKFTTTENDSAPPAHRSSNAPGAPGPTSTPQADGPLSTDADKTGKSGDGIPGRKSLMFPNLKPESGENETEDDAASGEENLDEGDNEEDDINENEGEDEEDPGTEEHQDGEDAGDDDAQDGEDAVMLEEEKEDEDEQENDDEIAEHEEGDPAKAVDDPDVKDSNAPTLSKATEKPESMDTTPA